MESRLLIRLESQTTSAKPSLYGSTERKTSMARSYNSMRPRRSRQYIFTLRSTQLAQSIPSPESLACLPLLPAFLAHSLVFPFWSPRDLRQAKLIPSHIYCPLWNAFLCKLCLNFSHLSQSSWNYTFINPFHFSSPPWYVLSLIS